MVDVTPVAKLSVDRRLSSGETVSVGTLAQNRQGTFFQYDDGYLRHYHSLSPFNLAWEGSLQPGPKAPHAGLHGLFADSLPDGWGLLLMDRVLRQHGMLPQRLTAMDRLAYIGDRGMGALSYRPVSPLAPQADDSLIELGRLGEEARRLFDGQTDDVLSALANGGSSGGARPKAQVYLSSAHPHMASTLPKEGHTPWLVKFTSSSLPLRHEEGLCEAAYLRMADKAGIEVPEWQLMPAPASSAALAWLATRRFDCSDKSGSGRLHLHSACGLLDADFRMPSLDYEELIKAGQVLCASPCVGQAIFRRALFNLLALNQDDHSKNWAFLMDDHGQWRLAPFFDVTYSPSPYGEHATAFGGHGKRPPLKVVQRLAAQANHASWREAQGVIEEVLEGISAWAEVARELAIARDTQRLVQRHLDEVRKENAGLLA